MRGQDDSGYTVHSRSDSSKTGGLYDWHRSTLNGRQIEIWYQDCYPEPGKPAELFHLEVRRLIESASAPGSGVKCKLSESKRATKKLIRYRGCET